MKEEFTDLLIHFLIKFDNLIINILSLITLKFYLTIDLLLSDMNSA